MKGFRLMFISRNSERQRQASTNDSTRFRTCEGWSVRCVYE